jgi:hypothetical protein
MARTFDLSNKTYHVAGRAAAIKDEDNQELLAVLGCAPTTLVRADVVIAGSGGKKKIEQARERGVTVITEGEALAALDDDGHVTLASSDITQIIGELRSLFAREDLSDSDRWLLCAGTLDRCDVDQVAPVLEYVRSAFVRAVDARQTWAPQNTKHRLMNDVNSKWVLGNPRDELFVAPPGWVLEMAAGDYHPKHALVRALNLDHQLFERDGLEAVLADPYLEGVHFLNFGRHTIHPGRLLGALDRFEGLALREIWLYDFRSELPGRLAKNARALRGVRKLVFHGCQMLYMEEYHYGSQRLSEADGDELVTRIEGLDVFDAPPRVEFRRIGNR